MEVHTIVAPSEGDDDIDALRLAALKTLKRKSQQSNEVLQKPHFGSLGENASHFNGSPRGKHKRGKFGRQQIGRPLRNGQFAGGQYTGWNRNSNLISVPMVTENDSVGENKSNSNDVPKLVLPQDRYCKKNSDDDDERTDAVTTKFDRYDDNSDESDSDWEENSSKSDKEESQTELKRSNSLEALMAELENEIQGGSEQKTNEDSLKEEKARPVKPKKKRKLSAHSIDSSDNNKVVENNIETNSKENLQPDLSLKNEQPKRKLPQNNTKNFTRGRGGKWLHNRRQHFPSTMIHKQPPPHDVLPPPIIPFASAPVQNYPPFAPPIGYDNNVYMAPPPMVYEVPPPQLPQMHVAPPVNMYERPLSPLVISTEPYGGGTGTLAPLSPRSAAFVLQNRAIIEKRKRRSYSRSPSPRFRRSKSPKRSSISPKRLSKSPLPKRRSLSPSPVRKVLPPKTYSPSKKSSIHERLGAKPPSLNKTERDEEKSMKEPVKIKEEDKKTETVDPVLEARRRKFEKNEITIKEGVIRLKAKDEENKIEKEKEDNSKEKSDVLDDEKETDGDDDIDEDALLEGDDTLEIDPKIDVLFSDEESDSDNEGRFKTKQDSNKKVAVLPFTKLINGAKSDLKTDLKLNDKRNETSRNDNERSRKFRSRSPRRKVRSMQKKKEKTQQSSVLPIDKKIEIKIRNPAKYEKTEANQKVDEKEKPTRKVEIAKKVAGDKSVDNEGEFNFESAEESLNSTISEGDLRAQLSRKRAERQKQPLPDVVPSRLLQSALQGVVFRKNKKTTTQDEKINESPEGKLPIHMRLGATNASEAFSSAKKSRKHKNKGSLEQV